MFGPVQVTINYFPKPSLVKIQYSPENGGFLFFFFSPETCSSRPRLVMILHPQLGIRPPANALLISRVS